jgi:PAS domain S-box-containing protein
MVHAQPFSQEYEALFNNAAISIITVDHEGNILLANEFALKQFGYLKEELVGNKIEILIPSRFNERHEKHRGNYIKNNPHNRPMGTGMDLYATTKSGNEFPVEVSLSSYDTGKGRFSIAFISDISIRKKSESALVELNAELEQKVQERTQSLTEALKKEKELNELKSRFVSMASHEFRTPLSTILSSAFLITKYPFSEEQSKRDKHIQRIVSSVNTLNGILNDFLSVGKIEEGRMQLRFEPFDIAALIKGLVSEMQSIAKKDQQIYFQHQGGKLVYLDPSLIKHIIMNLLSNAIKFSPENSTIQILTHFDTDFTLSVRDSGIGISNEDQQHLFERFFRGTNASNIQGTGLGLHIVTKYSELMNGIVNFKSELNKGTEFTITFKNPQVPDENNSSD